MKIVVFFCLCIAVVSAAGKGQAGVKVPTDSLKKADGGFRMENIMPLLRMFLGQGNFRVENLIPLVKMFLGDEIGLVVGRVLPLLQTSFGKIFENLLPLAKTFLVGSEGELSLGKLMPLAMAFLGGSKGGFSLENLMPLIKGFLGEKFDLMNLIGLFGEEPVKLISNTMNLINMIKSLSEKLGGLGNLMKILLPAIRNVFKPKDVCERYIPIYFRPYVKTT